ncbi:MAG: hypothetical protein HZA28_04935 [Candidatus Omnitrophica bacterium]|nr:hypothetical protein [Candidatus Omnitrophota bacterium]
MRYKRLLVVICVLMLLALVVRPKNAVLGGAPAKGTQKPASIAIDATQDGPVFGDPEGLQRVQKLESQLHQLKIREDHPRMFITKENIPEIRKKLTAFNPNWQEILKKADSGDLINAAFVYAVLEDSDPMAGRLALSTVKKILFEKKPDINKNWAQEKDAAVMALAFDWVYNGLTENEREQLVQKLARLNRIDERAKKIRSGYKEMLETFHREEWVFNSWRAWPEIALAHHVPDAEFNYKARWDHTWYYGDAARMYAYAADGTPFEGYYMGADGCDWFLALKSATGINLIDDPQIGWCRNAAYYVLYRLDFGLGREILHKGAFIGNGGILSYSKGISTWKFMEFLGRTMGLASDNPYCKWIINNISKDVSSWIMTTTGYAGLEELENIANTIYDHPLQQAQNPQTASYEELPYARFFPGGKEAVMRTSFRPESTCVGFTAKNAYTMTSHSDFDVNTFMIYKKGNLAPDSGVYDAYQGQHNYLNYQKNTTAHNDILIIDPAKPDDPRKLSRAVDPGGVELVSKRTFGAVNNWGFKDAFLHDARAHWTQILDFKTTKDYDYIIGEAAKAYSSRLNEFIRHLVFIRKGPTDNAYIIVFDRIETKSGNFIKKWLLHLVSEPQLNGKLLHAKIPGHYEIFDGDFLVATNVFNTAKLYNKTLLPKHRTIAKIGGDGFEFWMEGSRPRNIGISKEVKEYIEKNTGGPWQEVGTWRVEVTALDKKERDYFLNVLYAADIKDTLDPENISMREDDKSVEVLIRDQELGTVSVTMPKTGKPAVKVMFEKNK